MRNPRHLWAGDWREESARAREAAEEEAARHRAAVPHARPRDPVAHPNADPDAPDYPASGSGRRAARRPTMAVVVLAVAGLIAGAFAVGTLTGDDNAGSPLPAVGNTPIKPKKG